MNKWKRIFRHLTIVPWYTKTLFPQRVMNQLQSAIEEAEAKCSGQIRIAIEAGLSTELLWQHISARQRAIDIFSSLRVWDTENNNGVLIYLLLADHDVEIVADRGIAKRVSQDEWENICHLMESAFKNGDFESGLIKGIHAISVKLAEHFPASGQRLNELSDQPYIL